MRPFLLLMLLALTGCGAQSAEKPAKLGLCSACHGESGKAVLPDYPNLCGQNERYLVLALNAYRNGDRNNAQMRSLIGMLNATDIADLSRWYSQQRCEQ